MSGEEKKEQTNTPSELPDISSDKIRQGHIGSEERLMWALRKNRGIYAYAAADLGVSRQAVWEYVKRRPHLQAEIDEISETAVDRSEAELFKAIETGDVRAIMFHLRTKGKHRGYVERTEMVGDKGGPIQVQAVPQSAPGPADTMLVGIDVGALSREEAMELSELCDIVDKAGTSLALTPAQFARAQELIAKARPKTEEAEEQKALPQPE